VNTGHISRRKFVHQWH